MSKGNDHARYVVQILERGDWDVVKEDHEQASGQVDRQSDAGARAGESVDSLGGDDDDFQGRDRRFRDIDRGAT